MFSSVQHPFTDFTSIMAVVVWYVIDTKVLHWEVLNMAHFNKVASTTVASGEDDCEVRTL